MQCFGMGELVLVKKTVDTNIKGLVPVPFFFFREQHHSNNEHWLFHDIVNMKNFII